MKLNAGWVTIIGARGSGKTASADLIFVGCRPISSQLHKTSFIKRAGEYLSQVVVKLKWQTANETTGRIEDIDFKVLLSEIKA